MKANESLKEEIKKVLKKHNIEKAGIYGSYARGEANEKESDIDLIVELSENSL